MVRLGVQNGKGVHPQILRYGIYIYIYIYNIYMYMDVSENSGTPKSSILIGFSIINHPFWGTPIFGNTHIPSKERTYPLLFGTFESMIVLFPFGGIC